MADSGATAWQVECCTWQTRRAYPGLPHPALASAAAAYTARQHMAGLEPRGVWRADGHRAAAPGPSEHHCAARISRISRISGAKLLPADAARAARPPASLPRHNMKLSSAASTGAMQRIGNKLTQQVPLLGMAMHRMRASRHVPFTPALARGEQAQAAVGECAAALRSVASRALRGPTARPSGSDSRLRGAIVLQAWPAGASGRSRMVGVA